MRIEFLKTAPDRSGRYTLRFEDGSILRLYRQTIEDFGLYTGLELDEAQYKELLASASEMSAKMRAVRIVSASNVSKKDLESRLVRKGEDPQQARKAVGWLSDLHLIDDSATAETVVRSCIAKGYGKARAKQVLYEKRIPRELWEAALEDYPDQTEKIADFLRAKLNGSSDPKLQKRAIDALLRRGHSYGAIRQALSALSLDTDDFPEEE